MNALSLSVATIVVMLAGLAQAAQADDLPRRTYLGLQFDLEDRSGPGLLVVNVLPGSTAETAGMRQGDRLTSVGRIGVLESFPELRAELARTEAGQRIALRWYRDGNRVFRVSPPLRTLPLEVVPESLVRYDTIRVDDIGQRLIVSEPVGGARGLVFFLQGMECASYDYWHGSDGSIKALIDGWSRAGFATARLEKRGVGDSEGPVCATLSFSDEVRGYRAALAHLASQKFAGRIFLFGHSLGGLVAPLIASNAVAGVMVYGTMSVPWYDYKMENFARQDRLAGLDGDRLARRQALRSEFQQGLLFEGESPGALIERIPDSESLEDVQLAEADRYGGRSAPFFVQLAALNPARIWRQVWQPVLALHGEYDWVSSRADHERIARLSGGKFLSMAGLDHDFLRYQTLLESFGARGTGVFDPTTIEATVAWMAAIPLGEPLQVGTGATDTDDAPSPEQGEPTSVGRNR